MRSSLEAGEVVPVVSSPMYQYPARPPAPRIAIFPSSKSSIMSSGAIACMSSVPAVALSVDVGSAPPVVAFVGSTFVVVPRSPVVLVEVLVVPPSDVASPPVVEPEEVLSTVSSSSCCSSSGEPSLSSSSSSFLSDESPVSSSWSSSFLLFPLLLKDVLGSAGAQATVRLSAANSAPSFQSFIVVICSPAYVPCSIQFPLPVFPGSAQGGAHPPEVGAAQADNVAQSRPQMQRRCRREPTRAQEERRSHSRMGPGP